MPWFIHSFGTQLSIQPFIQSLIDSVSHSGTQSVIQSFIQSFLHLLLNSVNQSDIHLLIHSFNQSSIQSILPSFRRPFIHSVIHSTIQSLLQSFIQSCIHSLGQAFTYLFIQRSTHLTVHLFRYPTINPFLDSDIHVVTQSFRCLFTRAFIRSHIHPLTPLFIQLSIHRWTRKMTIRNLPHDFSRCERSNQRNVSITWCKYSVHQIQFEHSGWSCSHLELWRSQELNWALPRTRHRSTEQWAITQWRYDIFQMECLQPNRVSQKDFKTWHLLSLINSSTRDTVVDAIAAPQNLTLERFGRNSKSKRQSNMNKIETPHNIVWRT
jgi:hypothetical protein